jgi:hypothetical protein
VYGGAEVQDAQLATPRARRGVSDGGARRSDSLTCPSTINPSECPTPSFAARTRRTRFEGGPPEPPSHCRASGTAGASGKSELQELCHAEQGRRDQGSDQDQQHEHVAACRSAAHSATYIIRLATASGTRRKHKKILACENNQRRPHAATSQRTLAKLTLPMVCEMQQG